MNFKDIPQLTPYGSWHADFDLRGFVREIDRMVAEDGLQLNPDFQRGNVWTEAQQIAYVEFILRGGHTARTVYLNNPNWNRRKNDRYTDFVCVDGLQRITSISRFLKNDLPAFGLFYDQFEGAIRILNTMQININDLQTRKEVLQWYVDFNAGGTVHSDAEIARVKALIAEEQ